jgi:hypothetical protein
MTSRLKSICGSVLRALIFEFLPLENANTLSAETIFKQLNRYLFFSCGDSWFHLKLMQRRAIVTGTSVAQSTAQGAQTE